MPIALSYSRLSNYEQCAAQFAAKYVTKTYPDDSNNPFFIKGKKKHDQLDNYVRYATGKTNVAMAYDGDVESACTIVDSLIASGFTLDSELKLAVNMSFKQCNWFAKDTMYRSIVDILGFKDDIAIAGDWKTGKVRAYESKPTGQLHLTASMIFSIYPHVETVVAPYFFIEHKSKSECIFKRKDMDSGLAKPFFTAYNQVNSDKEFLPTKNEYCGFCKIKDKCKLW